MLSKAVKHMKIQLINNSKHQSPTYETLQSAGVDLRANIYSSITLKPLERALIKQVYLLLYLMGMKLKFVHVVD